MDNVVIPDHSGRYNFVKVINKGGFSVICLAQDYKTGEQVAVKIINREDMKENDLMEYLERELRLISRLSHPSLPKIYDIIYEENLIMIIMEYLPNGNIIERILEKEYFTLNKRIEVCYSILEGLNYLHERGIAHRDIKPENIVFDSYFNPKLIDFGFSCEITGKNATYCGTPSFMAPEIMLGQKYDAIKADMWSFGITAHIILTHEYPILFKNETDLLKNVRNHSLKFQILIQGKLRKFIESCLELNPEQRPTVSELLEMLKPIVEDNSSELRAKSEKAILPKLNMGKRSNTFNKKTKLIPTSRTCKITPMIKVRYFGGL
ncbi:CAMK family protein kinase [Trichomonas vaginalis G3]|uniref:CAMK family protein kinase n=1 Tax=Trichomonas vaginalis (strain ATCC PRA-98 / G3) TaxID=412133 RepID=A2FLC2_TRIV3|nr:protein serine/threonine kinase protein [Trichomonas vaginalis G3]EAX94303.1 CAMK family protein kinase [Trichomonas vaginalis G3]KAI5510349.1 protein serine/threonine kinase protein [Trichomonas vaginalis G3]|eukprot:XP_001307233.1 CAMK family protein kinase [Trichomonas vaginalis G3]